MAQVTLLKRQTNRAHTVSVAEATDELVIRAIERGTGGGASLWGDNNTTTIAIGGGTAQTAITIGKSGQTVTLPGNLTVQGTTTTLSTTNLVVSDNLMLLNSGNNGADSGIAFERGATGDDAVILWEEGNARFELGLADTTAGTVTPSAISAFRDLKVNNLLLDGTAITADGALTVAATGAANLSLTGQGTTYNLSASGASLTTTAQDIIGAINEIDGAAGSADTLAATLTAGNLTGATTIEISAAGSGIRSSAGAAATNPGVELDIIAGAGNTTGAGGPLTLTAGQGGATGVGGVAQLTSGAGGATSGNSGDVHIRVGSVVSGTAGVIEIGNVNATGVTISRTGVTTTVAGSLTSTQLLTATAGMSVGSTQSITGAGALTLTNTGVLTIGSGSTTTVELSQAGNNTSINGTLGVDQAATFTAVADFDAGLTLATGQAITGDGAITLTNTGAMAIGNGNTTTVTMSRTGQTTAVAGILTVAEAATFTSVADFDAGITLAASQAVTGNAAMSVIATGGTSDLTLGGRGATITLNQSGDTTLAGFTATSIVGALNELKSGSGSSSEVLVSLTNNTGSTITEGSVVYHTATDGEIADSIATSDNAASRPIGFAKADILDTAAGNVVTNGLATCQLVTGLTTAAGDEVFLSLTAGQATTDISAFAAGNVVQSIGFISDDSTYGASQRVELVLRWGSRTVL